MTTPASVLIAQPAGQKTTQTTTQIVHSTTTFRKRRQNDANSRQKKFESTKNPSPLPTMRQPGWQPAETLLPQPRNIKDLQNNTPRHERNKERSNHKLLKPPKFIRHLLWFGRRSPSFVLTREPAEVSSVGRRRTNCPLAGCALNNNIRVVVVQSTKAVD